MWQIIKAEYLYTMLVDRGGIFRVILGIFFLLFILDWKTDLMFVYLFVAGAVFVLHDDRRFHLYKSLPVSNKQIAFARLLMLAINFIVLITITIPFIIYNQVDLVNNVNRLLLLISSLLLVRIFTFSLIDIISGYFQKKKRKYLAYLFLFITPLIIAFIYITTVFFRKPELQMILIALSFSLIPLFTFISIKTFLAKERIFVREK